MIYNKNEKGENVYDRERSVCPSCGSAQINKRTREGSYTCKKCGWMGNVPKKIMWNNEMTYYSCGRHPGVRNRSRCPKCHSLRLYRYSKTYNYKCECCGWTGSSPEKIECGDVSWKKEKLTKLKGTKSIGLLSLKFQEKEMLAQNVVV